MMFEFFISEVCYIGVLQLAPYIDIEADVEWGGYRFGDLRLCAFCGEWTEASNSLVWCGPFPLDDMLVLPRLGRASYACRGVSCSSWGMYECQACDVHHLHDDDRGQFDVCSGLVCVEGYQGYHGQYCECIDDDDDGYPDNDDIEYSGEPLFTCQTCNNRNTLFDYVTERWTCSCHFARPNPIKEMV